MNSGRFGGTLNLEAASSFQSVVTGRATNTATADTLVDGLVNQTPTSTGEKQTLNFKINEQIDFNAGDTLGQAASAAAATYGSMLTLMITVLSERWYSFFGISI